MKLLKAAFTSAAMLAGGLFAMTPDNADAQIRFQIGGSSNGYRYDSGHRHDGHDHGYNRSGYRSNNYYDRSGSRYDGYSGRYGSGYRGYNNSGYNNRWHDTSHYDYHPTTVVPHGNHYDVIPGHYRYHQSGHWH